VFVKSFIFIWFWFAILNPSSNYSPHVRKVTLNLFQGLFQTGMLIRHLPDNMTPYF